MTNALCGNALVGQSGGPTAAINATLAGVIRAAASCEGIRTLYGMRNGIEGFLRENLVDLSAQFEGGRDIDRLIGTPAAALGSCRKKLPADLSDPIYPRLLELFRRYEIRYVFYIGGNDSMDTVAKLSAYMAGQDYEMRFVGVPKTIDNDLVGTDHTPGFGSAAKYIATTVQEILRDCAVYTVPAVTVVEIMGRNAGWLTAAAALPRCVGDACPDLIYLPERPFSPDTFFADVRAALARHPNVVVAVSEGIRTPDGRYVGEGMQSGAVDAFGHAYLAGAGKALEQALKAEIGCKVRSVELNLPQRCAAHLASATDLRESVRIGEEAVLAAFGGRSGCMMTFRRASDSPYRCTVECAAIGEVANAVREVPAEFITPAGNGITDACLAYLLPLIQGEVTPEYRNGLPVHFVL